jgi:peptide/nickel transport system permease protein
VGTDATAVPEVMPRPRAGGVRPLAGQGVLRFLTRRVLAGLVTLLVVSFLTFTALQVLPGNVASVVLGKHATPGQVHVLEHKLGFDKPFFERYGKWLAGAVHGDFGDSSVGLAQGLPNPRIGSLISSPMTNTLILAGLAVVLIIPLSLLLGVLGAKFADRAPDHAISLVTLIFISLPEFVVGSVLILLFFTALDLLPPVTLVPPGASPLDHPDALIMPALTLLLTNLAWTARLVRVGMVDVLRSDYIRSERLNGFPERRVVWRDGLRNGLAPSVQVFALTVQYLVGGVIVTEAVFSYPGLGTALVNAVVARDVTEVQAITVIVAAAYIAINIAADLLVVFLVPKLRTAL